MFTIQELVSGRLAAGWVLSRQYQLGSISFALFSRAQDGLHVSVNVEDDHLEMTFSRVRGVLSKDEARAAAQELLVGREIADFRLLESASSARRRTVHARVYVTGVEEAVAI